MVGFVRNLSRAAWPLAGRTAAVVLAACAAACALQKLDGVVAFVGDSIILSSELEAFILMKSRGVPDSSADSLARNMLRHQALDELIDGKVLLVHAVKDTNISITENEIDAELDARIQTILSQNNLSFPEFETLLMQQQGLSVSKFKEEVRKQIRQELLKQKVQQRYVAAGEVGRSDVEEFFAEYHDSLPPAGKSFLLSMLQITVSPSDQIRKEAFAKIKAMKERVDKGEDFSSVAEKFSEGPNASLGGDLGFIAKGTLNELAFEEKAFSMQPGETSDIFETRIGFHIISVIAKKDQMVHVKQLFVPVKAPGELVRKTRALLDSVRASATDTASFASAVRAFSTDKISRSQNGRLGWKELSVLDPLVRQAVDSLAVGAVSAIVSKDNSLSIYRCDDRKEFRTLSLENDWAEISMLAQRINAQKKLIELVNKWRQETFIDIRL
jgi:peptidyl-prolyl cis-trans isomerase SurA